MTVLKCWSSGCASNSSAVSGGGRFSSRAPVSSVSIGPSAIRDTFLDFASQLFVGNPASNDLFHSSAKPLCVRQGSVIVPEALFIDVPEQMEWLNANVGPMKPALQEAPKVFHCVRCEHCRSHTRWRG